MSVIPPLDNLTKAPALGVDKIQQQFNNILDSVVEQTNQTIKDNHLLIKFKRYFLELTLLYLRLIL